ncbi:hypothetical protein [Cellulomonas sp. KRMCY2]|uniref:hypothetical protein n=1 Tax=Cellulomonas sp. KRMCY2 TaxID=1304865 RepID=UPI00045E7529|nr:hypothetical protein [Cellulomonas sp. KRMCY2]
MPTPLTVAAVGERALLEGYPLAGVLLVAAETADAVRLAWSSLPSAVGVVVLTPRAAAALGEATTDPRSPMTVVLPS